MEIHSSEVKKTSNSIIYELQEH